MAEKELKFRTFDEIKGLNGEIFDEWNKTVKCAVFTRSNFKEVFQKIKIEDAPIVYTLTSLKEMPCYADAKKIGISSTILMSRKFYIGESSAGLQRMVQHCSPKDRASWWYIGVAFYSDNFNIDIIKTIEKILTEKAKKALPDYALVSDPKNTSQGKQNFPEETTIPFILRILGWLGIEFTPAKTALPEVKEKEREASNKSEIIFENPSHTARVSLNPISGEIRLLKGSCLADPETANISLEETARETLRKLPRDKNNALASDYIVHSPSGAAKLVGGASINGKTYWTTIGSKKPIRDFLKSKK